METQKLFSGVPDHDNWAVGPCETLEIAREVLRIAHEKSQGRLRWVEDQSFIELAHWESYGSATCYFLLEGQFGAQYVNLDYEYIPAASFIAANGAKVPMSPAEYWKTRCELLEKVHNSSPMDSIEAFKAYEDFLENNPEPK